MRGAHYFMFTVKTVGKKGGKTLRTVKSIGSIIASGEMGDNDPQQPSILMHRNIDHDNVIGYTNCYVNDSWEKKLSELISTGWVVFRIQTELCNGNHRTKAYLAKMKSS